MASDEPLPLPDDPLLGVYAQALNDAGHWAIVFDGAFRLIYMTDELGRSNAGLHGLAPIPIGLHDFAFEALSVRKDWTQHANSLTTLSGRYSSTSSPSFWRQLREVEPNCVSSSIRASTT